MIAHVRRWFLIVGSLALLAGCHREVTGPFLNAPVILISIDTLRSDHLPVYGYQGVATPAIDRLAKDAVLYERAYSHVPLTLPSHSSILSGRLPTETGVRDNIGYHFDAEKMNSLPVALGHAGYATGGAVSAFVLRSETGIGGGFDFYDSQVDVELHGSLGQSQRAGGRTTELLLGWLKKAAGGTKPVFAFLHLYEPHTPYTPPEPFASRYRDVPYDGEIATADSIVGGFLDELRNLGLYDRAIIVLLSDHGEGLGEHGEREHGLLLYRETLQVPLLLKLPGQARGGEHIATPVALVDVYPTILGLLGLKVPEKLPGRSLLASTPNDGPAREIYSETIYPRLHFGWSELSSLIQERFHYIHGPDPELYDLGADPGERRNVLRDERKTFAALRADIARYQQAITAPSAVDPEASRQLAALGYAASAVSVGANEKLPDPKSKISSLSALFSAMSLFATQRCAEAVPVFEKALAENPRMVDGWEHLAICLDRLGRLSDALAADQQALKLSGGAPHLAVATGYVLLKLGRFPEAKAHAELAQKDAPALANALLAEIALASHQPEDAERDARKALAAGGGGLNIPPLIALAEARARAGHFEEGLAALDQAERELTTRAHGQSFPGLSYTRGDLLARMGRNREAEAAFQREIHDNPEGVQAYSGLAMLYAAESRPQDSVNTLRRLVETRSSPAAYGLAVSTLRVLGDPEDAARLLAQGLQLFPQSPELRALSAAH